MIIAALNETRRDTRVAITPTSAKQYIQMGFKVVCESGAGEASGFSNDDYQQTGVVISNHKKALLKTANILVCVQEPLPKEVKGLPAHALLIAPLHQGKDNPLLAWAGLEKISLFSMNLIPRITRAQPMDSLSSQSNLAGYRAVLEAVAHFKRAVPMMMTAAGMIQPAKCLVLGAGVAGLQAVATAKRLGAVVYAFDVRQAAKEQVQSLGAEFIEVPTEQDLENSTGYAGETSESYRQQQAKLIEQYAKKVDIIISTALIPGKKAPLLLPEKTVEKMKPGSVIVDMATALGGNCELSKTDKMIKQYDVLIIGISNFAGLIPATASELYANNLLHLIRLLAPTPLALSFNPDDEIIKQALLCHEGKPFPFQHSKETP